MFVFECELLIPKLYFKWGLVPPEGVKTWSHSQLFPYRQCEVLTVTNSTVRRNFTLKFSPILGRNQQVLNSL